MGSESLFLDYNNRQERQVRQSVLAEARQHPESDRLSKLLPRWLARLEGPLTVVESPPIAITLIDSCLELCHWRRIDNPYQISLATVPSA